VHRQKQKESASAAMREALTTFETLGSPLWAEKARAALARSNVGPRTTPNSDVAAELFISPKTVEANLSRIYHKLGIRSRAELGRHMGQLNR
jgi:FixJ family two-component response regulator